MRHNGAAKTRAGADIGAAGTVETRISSAQRAHGIQSNTCNWWSLRQNGIDDKIEGFGSLLLEH